jgi:hypothetical protein
LEATTTLKVAEVKQYIAIPFLFSLAIFSNMKLLETANVETFMVFRFSTPIFVSLVDFALMGKSLPSIRTWLSFALIVTGAVFYAVTDKGFSVKTYSWALIYLVTITTEMIVVKHIFTVLKMSNWTRVYLNNFLSLIFQPWFFFLTSEQDKIPDLKFTPVAITFVLLSCFLGTALAWGGTALRVRISATSFTVVGVACKVVTEIVNLVMWEKHASELGLLALAACFLGSILFVPAASRSDASWFSNGVWTALNRITCGGLKRFELESPTFDHEAERGKYEIVSTTDNSPEDTEAGVAELTIDEDDIDDGTDERPVKKKDSPTTSA